MTEEAPRRGLHTLAAALCAQLFFFALLHVVPFVGVRSGWNIQHVFQVLAVPGCLVQAGAIAALVLVARGRAKDAALVAAITTGVLIAISIFGPPAMRSDPYVQLGTLCLQCVPDVATFVALMLTTEARGRRPSRALIMLFFIALVTHVAAGVAFTELVVERRIALGSIASAWMSLTRFVLIGCELALVFALLENAD